MYYTTLINIINNMVKASKVVAVLLVCSGSAAIFEAVHSGASILKWMTLSQFYTGVGACFFEAEQTNVSIVFITF